MERILYSKFSDDRKKKYCIRTDIIEKDGVKCVRKVPVYAEGQAHMTYINEVYTLLRQQYEDKNLLFNQCELKEDGIYLEYIQNETLQMQMESYIDAGDEAAIEKLLYEYMDGIQDSCKTKKFEKTDEFIEVFGDVEVPEDALSLEVTDIDLIFSNIMVGKKWEVIDYEWTFTFPIPIKYVIYRAFFLAHHQMRSCSVMELEYLMKLAKITSEERSIFQQMEENFQRYITGNQTPFRDIILSMDVKRTTMGEEFASRDQRIRELIELNHKEAENTIRVQKELIDVTQQKDQQILELSAKLNLIEGSKWWKLRGAILKILGK